ncbi:hypothetical protein [Methanocalculus chunghsingensis]|nr:hypothetical protein [Methanocalculus chunghsingensis]
MDASLPLIAFFRTPGASAGSQEWLMRGAHAGTGQSSATVTGKSAI